MHDVNASLTALQCGWPHTCRRCSAPLRSDRQQGWMYELPFTCFHQLTLPLRWCTEACLTSLLRRFGIAHGYETVRKGSLSTQSGCATRDCRFRVAMVSRAARVFPCVLQVNCRILQGCAVPCDCLTESCFPRRFQGDTGTVSRIVPIAVRPGAPCFVHASCGRTDMLLHIQERGLVLKCKVGRQATREWPAIHEYFLLMGM